MVTWGQNQIFTVPGNNNAAAPAPGAATPAPSTGFSFGGGTPAPAPATGAFGSTPAPATPGGGLFSSSSPAPAPSGGLFGSTPATPAPAPTGGLFGSTTPAPATGSLFGTPAPAPSPGGLFGTPAPSTGMFGAPAPSPGLFGAAAPQQAPAMGPQIPAHAAMQAHLDASARQEAAKLQTALEKYHRAYTGAPSTDDNKNQFVTIVYTDISPQQRQTQWLMRGQHVPPPKPPTVSEKQWLEAVVRNPDPDSYMPVALVGAMELQTRVAWQQDRANAYAQNLQGIQAARVTLQQRCDRIDTDLQSLVRIHTMLRSRLLEVMRKVELVRCMNQPLQQDEVTVKQRLVKLLMQVDQVNKMLATAQAKAKGQSQVQAAAPIVNVPDERELTRVLKGHRETLTNMNKVMEKDKRDLALLQHHVVPKVPLPPR